MAADLLVVLHLLFILYVIFGGLLVFCWPKTRYLHLPAATWGAFIEIRGGICPLTPLEHHFRHQGEQGLAMEGFIETYILPLVYPPGLTREGQIMLGLLVLIINGAVYGFFYRQQRINGSKKKEGQNNGRVCH